MWQDNNPIVESNTEPQRFEIPIFMAQLNTKITNLENQVEQLTKTATSNFDLYANLQKNIPGRKKSFLARHRCSTPGPKFKARYWSCKMWR